MAHGGTQPRGIPYCIPFYTMTSLIELKACTEMLKRWIWTAIHHKMYTHTLNEAKLVKISSSVPHRADFVSSHMCNPVCFLLNFTSIWSYLDIFYTYSMSINSVISSLPVLVILTMSAVYIIVKI